MGSWSALTPEEIQVVVKESFDRFKRQQKVKQDAMLQLEEDIKKKQAQARKRQSASEKPPQADSASAGAPESESQVAEPKSSNKKRRKAKKDQDAQSDRVCVKKEQDSQNAMALVVMDECHTMVEDSTTKVTRTGGRLGGRHAKGTRPMAYQKRTFSSNSHVSQCCMFICYYVCVFFSSHLSKERVRKRQEVREHEVIHGCVTASNSWLSVRCFHVSAKPDVRNLENEDFLRNLLLKKNEKTESDSVSVGARSAPL